MSHRRRSRTVAAAILLLLVFMAVWLGLEALSWWVGVLPAILGDAQRLPNRVRSGGVEFL